MSTNPVAIVGAGWAGLATAVTLARAGIGVNLYESARQTGGRARRLAFKQRSVDNGQHLFLGAYRETLKLMQIIGVDPGKLFLRQPLSLTALHQEGQSMSLKTPHLPAPLHLLWGLLTAKGLDKRDRLRAIQFGIKLKLGKLSPAGDCDVTSLLLRHKQTARLREAFWDPLVLAIMNTPPENASAEIFIQVLQDAFLYRRHDADLLFAKSDLGRLFPDPATDFIEQHNGHVHLASRITTIDIENNSVRGMEADGSHHQCEQVVLAVQPHTALRLLPQHPSLKSLQRALQQFDYAPICTVYLEYPRHVTLPEPMIGMLGGIGQWAFDRQFCGQAGLIAVIISADGPHMAMDNERLADTVTEELARLFPHWPPPLDKYTVREKRATFLCHNGINSYRPDNRTAIDGLWLAGDYTRTGYPATLEGAIRSGVQCAEQIIHTLR